MGRPDPAAYFVRFMTWKEAAASAALDRDQTHVLGVGPEVTEVSSMTTALTTEEPQVNDTATSDGGGVSPHVAAYPIPAEVVTVREVTPACARAWLNYNTRNRHLKGAAIAEYAEAMKAGIWRFNGDTIRFSWPVNENGDRDDLNGQPILLDGQNKLYAVWRSDRAQQFIVVTGLDPDSQRTMDQGVPRTVADNLGIVSTPNRTATAGGVVIALRAQNGDLAAKRLRLKTPEVMQWLADHPEFQDHANHAASFWKKYGVGPATLAYVRWLLYGVDPVAAEEFFRKWRESDTGGLATPLGVLVDKINTARETNRTSRHRGLDVYTMILFIIKTWNAHVSGKKVEKLQATRNGVRLVIPDPLKPTRDGGRPEIPEPLDPSSAASVDA